jgi:hypothetical protein
VLFGSPDRLLQSPFVLTSSAQVASSAQTFAVGVFSGDTHPDIAAIAFEGDQKAAFAIHAWLVPVTGDAEIDIASVSAGEALDSFDPLTPGSASNLSWFDKRSEMVSVELDAKGAPGATDEIVVLVPPIVKGKKNPGALFTLGVTPATSSQPAQFTKRESIPIGSDNTGGKWTMRKSDLDADGAIDVLVTYHDESGTHGKVFFNKQNGKLDPTPATVEPPSGTQLLGWAALNADADRPKEIAMLTDKGIFLVKLDTQARTFTVPTQPILSATGSGIACGDVNGDAIDDIVVAGGGVLQIFRGIPVLQ